MKKYYLIITLLILLFQITSFAQNYSKKFGRIKKCDIELNSYKGDTTIDAIVIYDKGKTTFIEEIYSNLILFERQTRIKILNNAGLKYAEIEIPLYIEGKKKEQIREIEAVTYNYVDNTLEKTKLDPSNAYEEEIDGNITLKKFAMPNVKPGSIIEFRYKKTTPYMVNLPDWEFQRRIPTLYSQYIVETIPFYEYTFLLQGTDKFDKQVSYIKPGPKKSMTGYDFNEVVTEFLLTDVPPFKDESFITSINDYIIKIDFQLSAIHYPNSKEPEKILTTWKKLKNNLLENKNFGKYLKKAKRKSKKIIKSNNLLVDDELKRFKKIVEYIKFNYKWNYYNRIFTDEKVKKIIKSKTGNSAEINLLLTGMLRAANIEAYPVIISTRSHGKIYYDHPFIQFFNYVIVAAKINDEWILADGTNLYTPYNFIPLKCINEKGLLINDKKVNWLKLNKTKLSEKIYNINIDISNLKDSALAEIDIISKNYDAISYRSKFNNEQISLKNHFEENNFHITSQIKTQNYNKNLLEPYKISFKAKTKFDKIGNKIFIVPLFYLPMSENPLKMDNRQYPVDFIYTKKRSFKSEIIIPQNYKIQHLPNNFHKDNDIIFFDYKINKKDNVIILNTSYKFKKPVYQPINYVRLKEFFETLIEKLNENIVIEKK